MVRSRSIVVRSWWFKSPDQWQRAQVTNVLVVLSGNAT